MGTSYGFVEITGVTAAIDAIDIMCKASNVKLLTWERKLGGRLVTIIIEGSVAAVKEAVDAATGRAIKKPVATGVMANPHEEVVRLVGLSASRLKKQDNDASNDKSFEEV